MKQLPLGRIVEALLILSLAPGALAKQEHVHGGQPAAHEHHQSEVKRRGAEAMGFDQDNTTHHFRLTHDGGFIQAETKDAGDTFNRDRIRQHLQEITRKFKHGDFAAPEHTHGQVPPGAKQMSAMKEKIFYTYEELERGGRVVISTEEPRALKAVHDFLRFQIADHQTGDPTTVQ